MGWIYVVIAGFLEVAWSLALKASRGFTVPAASVAAVVLMLASFVLLAKGIRTLPLGTAYAVWTGIGVVGAALAGIVFFGESVSPMRLVCIALIGAGIIGLRLAN